VAAPGFCGTANTAPVRCQHAAERLTRHDALNRHSGRPAGRRIASWRPTASGRAAGSEQADPSLPALSVPQQLRRRCAPGGPGLLRRRNRYRRARSAGHHSWFCVADFTALGLRDRSAHAVMCIDAIQFSDPPLAALTGVRANQGHRELYWYADERMLWETAVQADANGDPAPCSSGAIRSRPSSKASLAPSCSWLEDMNPIKGRHASFGERLFDGGHRGLVRRREVKVAGIVAILVGAHADEHRGRAAHRVIGEV
jgi:hypothetical protein